MYLLVSGKIGPGLSKPGFLKHYYSENINVLSLKLNENMKQNTNIIRLTLEK